MVLEDSEVVCGPQPTAGGCKGMPRRWREPATAVGHRGGPLQWVSLALRRSPPTTN